MSVQKNLIVQLKLYKGQVNYNEKGELTSPSQLIKLKYGIREWTLFLKSITQMGWTRVDVIKCLDGNKKIDKDGFITRPEVEVPDFIAKEIEKAMVGEEKPLTPEQKEIKELKAQMAELLKAKANKSTPPKAPTGQDDEALNKARAKYEEVIGEKPHHKKTLAGLNKEIETKLKSQE